MLLPSSMKRVYFKHRTRVLLILLFVSLGEGIAVALTGWHELREEQRSMSWPSTRGTVLHSEWTLHAGSLRSSMSTRVIMRYAYPVSGASYTSDRIAVWGTWGSTHEFINAHPAGSTITVYFDPDHPDRAVLVRASTSWLSWALVAAGAACLLVATWCFFRLRSTRHRGSGRGQESIQGDKDAAPWPPA